MQSKSSNSNHGNYGSKGGGLSRYQQQLKGKASSSSSSSSRNTSYRKDYTERANRLEGDDIDAIFGFARFTEGTKKLGWLLNYLPLSMQDETGKEKSGLDLYFLDREGQNFKATVFYEPYFYVDLVDDRRTMEIAQHLQKRFEGCKVESVDKEDLDLPGHLSGKKHKLLKLSFGTVSELNDVKSTLRPIIETNRKKNLLYDDNDESAGFDNDGKRGNFVIADPLSFILEMREHDVPYAMRVSIDLDLRVGAWFYVSPIAGSEVCEVERQHEMLELCEPRILAFDIECEKSPLKFPNAEVDRIYMISYMIDGQGYLLTNREVVSKHIYNFEYTPMSKYPGPFIVVNLVNEEELLRYFLKHIQELKPHVIVTYNGDFFDWPYVENRCNKYDSISIYKSTGIHKQSSGGMGGAAKDIEYIGRCIVHLDAFCWVQRDSYLPQGTQGLKAVTKNKLGYDPKEIDPEDMLRYAVEKPEIMATYSVSDAVATYYLYKTYVHNFIFSLSTVIPMGPEDVLRKGSGTLCEALLMIEAYKGNILCPNKQIDPTESFYDGHLLESETYIGGHVECLEAGVFRSDIPLKFTMVSSAFQQLINNIDRDLAFALETEHGIQRSEVVNYDQVKQEIVEKLEMLRDCPTREEKPFIYHLDVGAMYPNIILTNRLQPSAMVTQADCASCEFNTPKSDCKRPMNWTWRGEYNPATMAEYKYVKRPLSYEKIGDKPFFELPEAEQAALVRSRLKKFANTAYKRTKIVKEEVREKTICMRENPFYVNTVKDFRDRRYDYKLLTKEWKNKKADAEKKCDLLLRKQCEDKEVLMDSLQLAHKCILNSFYGYVMRKGARWRSIEMAGIVTHTGSNLITQARELVEQVGRPLELDTDGIWCVLPQSFPCDFRFKKRDGGKCDISYACAMLNADVHERYTNHQYQDRRGSVTEKKYSTHSECSIYFELDGPYKAMVLPASPEEGRLLKKKYVVYNKDNSIAELKGFEIKRRGELELVKIFQEEVFNQFLAGNALVDCYEAVGSVANRWLDVLDEKGVNMADDELMLLISEKKTISKTLEDYDGRKATSLTTAGRLADFLGADMIKDKGLNCNLVISHLPSGAPVTDRAIPVAIFSADESVKKFYLRKWLKEPSLDCDDFRDIIDWQYYKDRLGKSIQKIITIPAGMQKVTNPCPRIVHPMWLQRFMDESASGLKQTKIDSMFKRLTVADSIANPSLASSATCRSGNSVRQSISTNHDTDMTSPRKRERDSDNSDVSKISDMEDYGKSPIKSLPIPVAHFKKTANATYVVTNEDDVVGDASTAVDVVALPFAEHVPNDKHELLEWLQSRKKSWKRSRIERKQQLTKHTYTMKEELSVLNNKKSLNVEEFARLAELNREVNHWQILEIQLTENQGECIVWAMTSKTILQKIKVTVSRCIYVNCVGKEAEAIALSYGGIQVKRVLPHGRPCMNLYAITLSEAKYQKNDKELSSFLCHRQVEGVYEGKVPLLFRAILNIGCVSQVKKDVHTSGSSNSNSYKIENFQCSSDMDPYLYPKDYSFKRIYLYYTTDKTKRSGFGAIGMFIIDKEIVDDSNSSSSSNEGNDRRLVSRRGFVWISNGRYTLDSAKPQYQKICESIPDTSKNFKEFPKIITSFTSSMVDALKGCNDKLSSYLRERNGPTLVIVQGSMNQRQWRKKLSYLQDFPLAIAPHNTTDDMFPAMQWRDYVASRMLKRFNYLPVWYNDCLRCARFSRIPLCNLGNDFRTSMTDVLIGRQLMHNRHLLWASDTGSPDLGGSEEDEHGAWSDPLVDPIINDPGAYRCMCVELEVNFLEICAIIGSDLLGVEGLTNINIVSAVAGQGVNNEDMTTLTASSSDTSCAEAFRLLKASVFIWHRNAVDRGDDTSDSLLVSFYRYLSGYGDSLLHDPSLHRIVHSLMTKLFKKLVAEFRKLGTKVIYADFKRIIIHTSKYDTESARCYIDFIIAAITEMPLFDVPLPLPLISVKSIYEQLLWLSPDNYSAILPDHAVPDDGSEEHQVDANDNTDEILREVDAIDAAYNTSDKVEAVIADGSAVNIESSEAYSYMTETEQHNQEMVEENLDWLYNDTGDGRGDADDYIDEDSIDEADTSNHHVTTTVEEQESDDDPCFISHWNLASSLPQTSSVWFKEIVKHFLYRYSEERKKLCSIRDDSVNDVTMYSSEREKGNALIDDDDIVRETTVAMSKFVSRRLSKELLRVVEAITAADTDSEANDTKSIQGMGSRSGKNLELNAKLEFVKVVMHVLSLDTTLEDDLGNLRRLLLTRIKVREFNDESVYKESGYSYTLHNAICSFCHDTRNMDLLKDPLHSTKEHFWDCVNPRCKHQLNKNEVSIVPPHALTVYIYILTIE